MGKVKMIIIAGNYEEYLDYTYANDLKRTQCPYVYHGDQLKQYPSDTPVILVGSYIKNPAHDWQHLFTHFKEVIPV
jgi:hypothetical protein